jgi:hypothetical protein
MERLISSEVHWNYFHLFIDIALSNMELPRVFRLLLTIGKIRLKRELVVKKKNNANYGVSIESRV